MKNTKSSIKIYIDGPTQDEMIELSGQDIAGFTFNPTLFKSLGVTDYLSHSKEVQRISILRLTQNEGEKLEYFEEEPGEWIICLIELFPKIFAPRRISTLNSYKMSWWAPRWQLGITLVLMTFCLVFITPYIPTLACTTYLIFILIFLSQREVLLVDRQSLRWERHVLGINVSYQQWNTINSVLNTHLYAPSGISVLIYDKMYQHGKEFGHTWDAAWIHQELIRILEEQTQVQ